MDRICDILWRYDSLLNIKGRLNGEKVIVRQSPYNRLRQHDIYSIRNKFLGSGRWLLKKLMQMDSQKHDFVKSTLSHNEKIRSRGNKFDREMNREVAKFIRENEKIIL